MSRQGTWSWTVIYVTDIDDAELVGRAHREVFGDVRPASTMVQGLALVRPEMRVEIEAYAVIDVAAWPHRPSTSSSHFACIFGEPVRSMRLVIRIASGHCTASQRRPCLCQCAPGHTSRRRLSHSDVVAIAQ